MKRRIDFVRWFLPGLGVKRWLAVAVFGAVLFVNGASRWLTDEGAHVGINELVDWMVGDFFPPADLSYAFLIAGFVLVALGIWRWLNSIVSAVRPYGTERMIDALLDTRLKRGYKIVTIGGGTGLATLLRGLKKHTSNLTAVVTVSDDGGSSGRLQKELGVLPPGDIRNCLVALADDEALVTDLFRYRFTEGDGLAGHSFGNLFLAALTGITGNFDDAIKVSSRVLNIKGRVLPATLSVAQLGAKLSDGTLVEGESNISKSAAPIDHVFLDPPYAEPPDEVIAAIRDADAIVLGPGSLYTSIMPNLLVQRVAHEIEAANAVKIYVCNVMTQPGETVDYTASKHVEALIANAKARVCDIVIVNDEPPSKLLDFYAEERQLPVVIDKARLDRLHVQTVRAPVISETDTVRHDSEKLAAVVIGVIDQKVAQRASYVKFKAAPADAESSVPLPRR
ncbi:MAG TPA: gluconeogenesis factor YvcK family protein [Candidatus Lustribacter sp.]